MDGLFFIIPAVALAYREITNARTPPPPAQRPPQKLSILSSKFSDSQHKRMADQLTVISTSLAADAALRPTEEQLTNLEQQEPALAGNADVVKHLCTRETAGWVIGGAPERPRSIERVSSGSQRPLVSPQRRRIVARTAESLAHSAMASGEQISAGPALTGPLGGTACRWFIGS